MLFGRLLMRNGKKGIRVYLVKCCMGKDVMQIHHVGYLSFDIKASCVLLQSVGFTIAFPEYEDEFFDQRVLFMRNDNLVVELIQPRSEEATAYGLLKKKGPGPYHICYIAPNFDNAMRELRKQRFIPTGKPMVAETGPLKGARIAFLVSRDHGLIELVEDMDGISV